MLDLVEQMRVRATDELDPERRGQLGQFLTPVAVARFMASMAHNAKQTTRVLDAGAGVGSLAAALVNEVLSRETAPCRLELTAYEIDPKLADALDTTMALCETEAIKRNVSFHCEARREDFIRTASETMEGGLLAAPKPTFDIAILNPPYRKIRTDSLERKRLEAAGLQTTNLYTGFLYLAAHLLAPGGELIAITPRSFCNGPYFRTFRKAFLSLMAFERIHVFDSRDRAFGDDGVLQENIIFRARRMEKGEPRPTVKVTSSHSPDATDVRVRVVPHAEVVRPNDPDFFIHIVADEANAAVADKMRRFTATLASLGVSVSTGPVVDFRATDHLRKDAGEGAVPLLYPAHLVNGRVRWPKPGFKKFNGIARNDATEKSLIPSGNYVLAKRFSAKEETRRIVAGLLLPEDVPDERLGLENHINYFHEDGHGLPFDLARGLAAYLNSTLVDAFFRQFNGHTQVNATDLRALPYPTRDELARLGKRAGDRARAQADLDGLVEEFFGLASRTTRLDAVKARRT